MGNPPVWSTSSLDLASCSFLNLSAICVANSAIVLPAYDYKLKAFVIGFCLITHIAKNSIL